MRREVDIFAHEMEAVLQLKDSEHPNGWEDDTVGELMDMLDSKLSAMIQGYDGNLLDQLDIHSLAVDIGNYAMMIADKVRETE